MRQSLLVASLALALWSLPAAAQDTGVQPAPAAERPTATRTAPETTGAVTPANPPEARWQREVERHNDRMLRLARVARYDVRVLVPRWHRHIGHRIGPRHRW